MSKSGFGDIRIFVEVARRGGFRAAADHLQQAPASVSQAIQRFEERLGVKVFERSTRAVALTAIGEELYRRSLPAVTDLEAAIEDLENHKDEVAGRLRLTAPYSAGPFFLDELVAEFSKRYEAVDIELIYDDKKVDLISSGVDAAIRSNMLLEQDTHAFPIGPELNMSIVASPEYLSKHGMPDNPDEILNHDAICYAFGKASSLAPWTFKDSNGTYTIQPKPKLVANDMRSLLNYAQNGLGLAYIYSEIAKPFLDQGKVVGVLGDHIAQLSRYSVNYRSKRLMTRRLRSFLDMAKGVV